MPNTIIQQLPGASALDTDKLCIFASYINSGIIHEYLTRYLESLHSLGFEIIFVPCVDSVKNQSDASSVQHIIPDYSRILPYVKKIITREKSNPNYYFQIIQQQETE